MAEHQHEVDLAIATIVPLIFLTALLPEAPDDPKNKGQQYFAQGFTIVFGTAALVVAFLQLAGEQTKNGTALGLILLGATVLSAICAMAWRIMLQIGLIAYDILVVALGIGFLLGVLEGVFHVSSDILWILLPIVAVIAIPFRIASRLDQARRNRAGQKEETGIFRSIRGVSTFLVNLFEKGLESEQARQEQGNGEQNHNVQGAQSSAVANQASSANQPKTIIDYDTATKNLGQTGLSNLIGCGSFEVRRRAFWAWPEFWSSPSGSLGRLLADAEQIARSIRRGSPKAAALREVAQTAAATDPDRAERIAYAITSELSKAVALMHVATALAATDPDRAARLLTDAERMVYSFTDESSKPSELSFLATVLAVINPDRAERIAHTITDEGWKVSTLSAIAEALAAPSPPSS